MKVEVRGEARLQRSQWKRNDPGKWIFTFRLPTHALAPSLTLFEISFASGHIPIQWKQGNVVPVHKTGVKSQVSNYRPISLLCIVSKVMGR